MMWILIVAAIAVWVFLAAGFLLVCKMPAISDRLNDEMKEFNERTGFKWH